MLSPSGAPDWWPSLVLLLAATATVLLTAKLCLTWHLNHRLTIIAFLSTTFAAHAAPPGTSAAASHALVQTAGVMIAVLLNIIAAVFMFPETGTMRGASR